MKTIFLVAPPASSQAKKTWEVGRVLTFIKGRRPISSLSPWQLAWRTFFLVLLFSCRRIADLTLLCTDALFLQISQEHVILQ